MGIFNFFRSNNKLSNEEEDLSLELFYIIKEIQGCLEKQFLTEENPERIDINKFYRKYSDEKFQKMVFSILKTKYYYDINHKSRAFELSLKSLAEEIFSYSRTRGLDEGYDEIEILLKGTDLQKNRLVNLSETRQKTLDNLLLYCTSKKILLDKLFNQSKSDKIILKLLRNAISNLKK